MAPKRATFYTFGNESACEEAKKYIENAGVLLKVRKIDEEPLSVQELKQLIGHIDLKHFLNTASPDYAKLNLDDISKTRYELFDIIAENNHVLRRPIVSTIRLITIGCDKKRLSEMLQISQYNSQQMDDSKGNLKNSKYVTRRTPSKSNDTKASTPTPRVAK